MLTESGANSNGKIVHIIIQITVIYVFTCQLTLDSPIFWVFPCLLNIYKSPDFFSIIKRCCLISWHKMPWHHERYNELLQQNNNTPPHPHGNLYDTHEFIALYTHLSRNVCPCVLRHIHTCTWWHRHDTSPRYDMACCCTRSYLQQQQCVLGVRTNAMRLFDTNKCPLALQTKSHCIYDKLSKCIKS